MKKEEFVQQHIKICKSKITGRGGTKRKCAYTHWKNYIKSKDEKYLAPAGTYNIKTPK